MLCEFINHHLSFIIHLAVTFAARFSLRNMHEALEKARLMAGFLANSFPITILFSPMQNHNKLKMNKLSIISLFLFCFANALYSQTDSVEHRSEKEKYEWRLRQEVLYGTYIPKDVNEVLLELNKKIDSPSKAKFATLTETEAVTKLFFSLGRWMTHNWGLYEGSRLSKYIQDLGIHHPDDMVRFFIIIYHRSLTKQPLEVKALIAQIQEKEAAEKQERLKNGTILHEEKKKIDKPKDIKN